jgi:eukaryotic-like serine/threonine-protein kinase
LFSRASGQSFIFAGYSKGLKGFMKHLFRFIFSRVFWINLALAILVVIAIVFGSMQYLKSYSMHGETITVPDLRGTHFNALEDALYNRHLRYLIVDSVYSDSHKPGVVVNQNPDADAQVKKGRTIYLTVNAILPPLVTVRDMSGLSRRQALSMLEVMGLQMDSITYKPDICLDCVLEIRHKGQILKGGTKIKKGDKVTLVLGAGSEGKVLVPKFIGLTYPEAKTSIQNNFLTLGDVLECEGCVTQEDSMIARVYRQIPPYYQNNRSTMAMGQPVDLFLTIDTLKINSPELLNDDDFDSDFETESESED